MISPFRILAKDSHSHARTGVLYTQHGAVHTPVFMPVATQACVKALTDEDFSPKEERYLSLGMSEDFTVAVEAGSTLPRIGSKLFA